MIVPVREIDRDVPFIAPWPALTAPLMSGLCLQIVTKKPRYWL